MPAASTQLDFEHDVLGRVLFVSNIPLDTKEGALLDVFKLCLGSKAVAFLQYPYDAENECHKGFAFVLVNSLSDVDYATSRQTRHWFYLEGKANQEGYNASGRCYLRIRLARPERCHKKELATHLIVSPSNGRDEISMREFKLLVEDVLSGMQIKPVKVEAEISGKNKLVHIHSADAETSAVLKMFCHGFNENGVTMAVRYALKPKAGTPARVVAPAVVEEPTAKYVIEPITEMTGKFGIPYAQVVKANVDLVQSSPAPAVSAKASSSAAPVNPTTKANTTKANNKASPSAAQPSKTLAATVKPVTAKVNGAGYSTKTTTRVAGSA